MLRHQNPSELVEDEVLEGEILAPQRDPDHFPAETDIEIFVSDGHVNWAQMSNFLRTGMFFVPACLLASTALIGISFTDFPSVSDIARSILRMKQTEYVTEARETDDRSLLGRGAYSLIGWDPDTAVALPDGQRVHARLSFLSQLPDGRIGELDAEGYRALIDDYRASITRVPSPDEQAVAQAEDHATRLEESSEWNLQAWSLRYRIATLGQTADEPTEIETVPAQGFWQEEANLEKMATDGVIADDGVNFYAAAFVDGVPAVAMFTTYGCYTIVGVGYDGCEPLSNLGESGLERIRDTLYGDAVELVAEAPVEDMAVEEGHRWYLDFPLVSNTSALSSSDFDTLFSVVDNDMARPDGVTLHTRITSVVSAMPSPAMAAPAQGMLKNPAALDAMKEGGVVGTTDVPGRIVVAAYIDNEVQLQVRTESGLCSTVFGDETYGCRADNIAGNAELRDLVTSLYEEPDAGDALKPYFWFSAPMIAETSLDGNEIVTSFNAALQDVANHGDNLAAWTNTPELANPPLIARPDGFFSNPDNLASLATKGAVILPRDTEGTFMLAANYQGRLSLSIVEIPTNGRWTCSAVFGQVGQPIGECRQQDLTKYEDVVKSMFAQQ